MTTEEIEKEIKDCVKQILSKIKTDKSPFIGFKEYMPVPISCKELKPDTITVRYFSNFDCDGRYSYVTLPYDYFKDTDKWIENYDKQRALKEKTDALIRLNTIKNHLINIE